jgi:hypothetical protein
MKVRFNANACGFGFGYPEGAEAELSSEQADKAITLGCAVPVKETTITTAESKAKVEKVILSKNKK